MQLFLDYDSCDENKYRFETYTKREKNRYVNPIVNAMKDRKQ